MSNALAPSTKVAWNNNTSTKPEPTTTAPETAVTAVARSKPLPVVRRSSRHSIAPGSITGQEIVNPVLPPSSTSSSSEDKENILEDNVSKQSVVVKSKPLATGGTEAKAQVLRASNRRKSIAAAVGDSGNIGKVELWKDL